MQKSLNLSTFVFITLLIASFESFFNSLYFSSESINLEIPVINPLVYISSILDTGIENMLGIFSSSLSVISSDYYRINQSDFYNSDDSLIIKIIVELDVDSIPTLNICNAFISSTNFIIMLLLTFFNYVNFFIWK